MTYCQPYLTACTHSWNFNHTPVANVSDGVGSITLTNHSVTTESASNGAYDYHFLGSSSQYMDGGTATTGIGSGNFTIEIICYIHTIATTQLMLSRTAYPSSKELGWYFGFYSSIWYGLTNFAPAGTNNISLYGTKNNWTADKVYHFFVTAAPAGGANNYKQYWMDGTTPTLDGQATYNGSPDETAGSEIDVGRQNISGYNYYFTGGIYLIRIHNAVLTAAQMTQNYKAEGWRYAGPVCIGMTVPGSTTAPGAISPHVTKTMTVPGTTMTKGTATPVVKPVMTVPGMTATRGTATPVVKPTMTVPGSSTAPGAITPKVTKVMTVPGTTLAGSAAFAYIEMSKTVTMPCPTATLTVGHATPNIKIIMPCPDFTTDEGEIAIGVRIALTAPDITLDVNFITTTISIYALPSECDVTLEWPLVTIGFAEYPAVSTDETIEYAATETSTINEWPDETTFEEEWSRRCT